MKIKGSLKHKLLSLVFFIISAGLVFVIFKEANKSREVQLIPVLTNEISIGTQIQSNDLKMIEYSKLDIKNEMALKKEYVISMYAKNDMKPGRPIYKEDITNIKPPTKIKEKLKYGAISVTTDLAKCVGGIPEPGDYVKVKILMRNEQTRMIDILEYEELSRIQIVTIQNQSGSDVEKEKETQNKGTMSNVSVIKPALVTFDATNPQQNKLLIGEYSGEIHLVLLPEVKEEKKAETITPTSSEKAETKTEATAETNDTLKAESGNQQNKVVNQEKTTNQTSTIDKEAEKKIQEKMKESQSKPEIIITPSN